MNLDDKHFYVFCYTQSINPTKKAWKLYEAFFKPQYKYIDEIYKDIKAVLDFDLEAHALQLYPTLIKGTYKLNENGTDITFNPLTPCPNEIDYDSYVYKLFWKEKNGLKDNDNILPDLVFKSPYSILNAIKGTQNNLKLYVGSIVRKNPLTYSQLFQLPVISSTTTVGNNIYEEFNFKDVVSFDSEEIEIKDFKRDLVFTDSLKRGDITIEVCTYKNKPLLVTSVHSNSDYEDYNTHHILDSSLYQKLKEHVYNLCEKYESEETYNIVNKDSEFNLIYKSLKGKCF